LDYLGNSKRTAVEPVTRLKFENNRIEVGNRKRQRLSRLLGWNFENNRIEVVD
jgi:hypothetical protein